MGTTQYTTLHCIHTTYTISIPYYVSKSFNRKRVCLHYRTLLIEEVEITYSYLNKPLK
jgi:hypothetical protein